MFIRKVYLTELLAAHKLRAENGPIPEWMKTEIQVVEKELNSSPLLNQAARPTYS